MSEVNIKVNNTPIAEISDKFLSLAIDLSLIQWEDWWSPDTKKNFWMIWKFKPKEFNFKREKLINLSKLLSPAYIRISWTKSDELVYFKNFKKKRFDEINEFAIKCGFKIIFWLNAGSKVRDKKKNWLRQNAEKLVSYTHKKNYPVEVWELGNEVNAFVLKWLKWRVNGKQYAKDMQIANDMIKSFSKEYKVAWPSSAFLPLIWEPFPIMKSFLKNIDTDLDIISWHYYPQQSKRSLIATRRAKIGKMLKIKNLDEIGKWSEKIEKLKNKFSPKSEIWLTETWNALCWWEPWISDRFVWSLWWLDQLWKLAKRNYQVVVRQTLSWSNYGLINDETLKPTPDYFASILWKKLMWNVVYQSISNKKFIRIYTHNYKENKNKLASLIINTHKQDEEIILEKIVSDLYLITAERLDSEEVFLNWTIMKEKDLILKKEIKSRTINKNEFKLPAYSYAFFITENE